MSNPPIPVSVGLDCTEDEMGAALAAHRVRLVAKVDSPFMRLLGVLLKVIGNHEFQSRYWTTIARTVYYPTSVTHPLRHTDILVHELVHVQQWQRWNVLFWLTYLLVPVPFGLAWFRWRWEREAYLVQLRAATDKSAEIERIVTSLWTGYGWPWPKAWMRRWFENEIAQWDH